MHVPFCAHRCHYCDFNVVTGADTAAQRELVRAIATDVRTTAAVGPAGVAPPGSTDSREWPVFGSIFIGGGTPTRLPPGELAALLRTLRDALPVAADAEVTVEANPEDVTVALLKPAVAAGLTRLSLGAQSFVPGVLTWLERGHTPQRILDAVAAAREAGVSAVSLDLIYGAPAETEADWRRSVEAAVGAETEHLSAYALTLEPNTVYAVRERRGGAAAPDDDAQAERMGIADELFGTAGFERYEISNWARPGHASRHNLVYWQGGDWLAFGPGAHGHWQGRRWWTHRGLARYIRAAAEAETTTAGEELLDAAQRRTERLMMGLRLTAGVARAEVEPIDERQAAVLSVGGLLADDGERLRLTARGRPVAGAIMRRLASLTAWNER